MPCNLTILDAYLSQYIIEWNLKCFYKLFFMMFDEFAGIMPHLSCYSLIELTKKFLAILSGMFYIQYWIFQGNTIFNTLSEATNILESIISIE